MMLGIEEALAASAERSLGTGERRSGRDVKRRAIASSLRERKASVKELDITGLHYRLFARACDVSFWG